MEDLFCQCLLQQETSPGKFDNDIIWIPKKFATCERLLLITNKKGLWRVKKIYATASMKQLIDGGTDWRSCRELIKDTD